MSLYQDIESQLKDAMRAQDKDRLMALRNIKSVLKNKAIDAKRELNDAEVVQALSTLAKQRKESIEAFQSGGRQDLVEKEAAELKVIEEFLPQQLSAEELEKTIREAIAETQAQGAKDMGKVMKAVQPKVMGRADGKIVSELVKKLLG
ncbi:GatB/YqeY domain-containing protein [Deltaproteobacteria bacterium PRO3]|nr:GatB/YqeY domain-containing protein [Deltaproteobacteria bacterium PRO3]